MDELQPRKEPAMPEYLANKIIDMLDVAVTRAGDYDEFGAATVRVYDRAAKQYFFVVCGTINYKPFVLRSMADLAEFIQESAL